MNPVVDITGEIQQRQHVERFARLMGLAEKYEADLAKNPKEFMRRAAARMAVYEARLDEIRDAVYPAVTVGQDARRVQRPHSVYAEAVSMVSAVRRLLNTPLSPPLAPVPMRGER